MAPASALRIGDFRGGHTHILIKISSKQWLYLNIATGETSQAITSFHFFDNLNFHH